MLVSLKIKIGKTNGSDGAGLGGSSKKGGKKEIKRTISFFLSGPFAGKNSFSSPPPSSPPQHGSQ